MHTSLMIQHLQSFRENILCKDFKSDSVPTQIVYSNSLCFSRFFPIQLQIFPMPIYIICDYHIHKTDL